MKYALTTLGLALLLAGCQGPAASAGLFGRTRISSPPTAAGRNDYYPLMAATGTAPSTSGPLWPATGSALAATREEASTSGTVHRRSLASISRSGLARPSQRSAANANEDPVRIPSGGARDALAAVVPIRRMPTTDVSLLGAVRASLQTPATTGEKVLIPTGFIELAQLPDAPDKRDREGFSRR